MTNFSLSDVLRHIITGTFFLLFFVILIVVTTNIELIELKGIFQESEWLWIIILVISYPLGILIQSINKSLQKWNKCCITDFLFSRYSIKRKAHVFKEEHRKGTPEWIYTADEPEKIVEYMEMEIEKKKNAVINEYYYFCELFQGLYIVIILLPMFLILTLPFINSFNFGTLHIKLSNGTILLFVVVIWFIIGVLSFHFAHFYAKKFIHSLDAYKDVLSINIDKYMHELGVQRVFVMMRTVSNAEYLEDAIRSVYKQDYYDINFVVLEDNAKPTLEKTMLLLHEKYGKKRNNVRLLYYYSESGSPAQSSYAIRNIILNIADRDDDIVFILDDDDMFAHNNVISNVVYQMNKQQADVCLVKFNIIGVPKMNISRNGGNTHNNLTTKLCKQEKNITIEDAPCLCFASSLGWSKIYRMGTLRKYFLMINDTKEKLRELDLNSYEDFPDFLLFLLRKDSKKRKYTTVTGLDEPAYLYRKHENTATREISKKAFQEWRINQLRLLVATANSVSENELIDGYKEYLGYYLEVKTKEIGNILEKYKKEGLISDYSKSDFENDLRNSPIAPYLRSAEKKYKILKECVDKNNNDDTFDKCSFDQNCFAC